MSKKVFHLLVLQGRTAFASSLAVRHLSSGGITFRHTFFIKRGATGEFVRWGATGEACHPHVNTNFWMFGPDVVQDTDEEDPSAGIFGLDHDALVRSEWVHDDTLTVKVERECERERERERDEPA